MAAETVRVGIIGAGANTRGRHIPGLKAIDGVSVTSVCNRSRESSQSAAEAFAIPAVYDTWEALVAADDSDAICIGTWPYLHCPATLAALQAGKHVLCEARMANNAGEARQMLAAAQAKPELVTQVVPSPFTLAIDATVKEWVTSGRLGEPYALKVRGLGSGFADFDAPLGWRQDKALSGNNIMALGIWYEAVMRWIGEATHVMARGKVCVSQRKSPETGEPVQVDIPDLLDVLADMACGAQAHFEFSGVTGLAPSPEVLLFGSEATLRYDVATGKLFAGRRGDKALALVTIPPEMHGSWRVEEEFVGAIRGAETVKLTTFEDGVRYMAFTDAVNASLASGKAEEVTP